MDTQTVFDAGETVPIRSTAKNWAKAFVDPSSGLKVTLTNPTGAVILNDVAMTAETSGNYVYYYTSLVTSVLGEWQYKVKATDGSGGGAKITIAKGSFKLV